MGSLKQTVAALGTALVGLAGCGGEPGPEPNPLGPEPPEEADPAVVWQYLQEKDYQRYWHPESLASPGLHRSREPHGPLIRVYLNRQGHNSRPLGQEPLPPGTVVVLESYTSEPTLHTIDVMAKIPGHRPATNDWAFFRYGPSGTVRQTDHQIRLQAKTENRGCIHCHARTAEETDYLFQPRLAD
ncbi:cytochrome P460 family protein [Thiohalorhabdus sp.]|uniref:cytochrome P460 family protein n=1 Tax=Thiohalorhabdus sp. TaxID=3094134 RepID=UPI002FC3340F